MQEKQRHEKGCYLYSCVVHIYKNIYTFTQLRIQMNTDSCTCARRHCTYTRIYRHAFAHRHTFCEAQRCTHTHATNLHLHTTTCTDANKQPGTCTETLRIYTYTQTHICTQTYILKHADEHITHAHLHESFFAS